MWKSITAVFTFLASVAAIISLFRDVFNVTLPFSPQVGTWIVVGILVVLVGVITFNPTLRQQLTQVLSNPDILFGIVTILTLLIIALTVQALFERGTIVTLETQITQVAITQTAQGQEYNVLERENQGQQTTIAQARATQVAYTTAIAEKEAQIQSMCTTIQESNGTVVFDAQSYTTALAGRKHPFSPNNTTYDATHVSWQENSEFPGTLQAAPNITPTNTFSSTNGPALIYTINFSRPDTYFVYVRGFGIPGPAEQEGGSDSIHVGLGGVAVTTTYSNGLSIDQKVQEPRWYGLAVREGIPITVEVPNPGVYTFFIWARENGVVVDRVWLDTRNDAVAQGSPEEGPASNQCVILRTP